MPASRNFSAAEFGGNASQGSLFLSRIEDIDREPRILPYAHYLRQAWRELGLSGVLCVDNRPTVYLCEQQHFTTVEKRRRQRFAWNQGLAPLLVFLTPNQVEVHSAVKTPQEDSPKGELFESELPSLIAMFGNLADALEQARLVRSIETGQFFQEDEHTPFFRPEESVDHCLVENLRYTTQRLRGTGWSLAQAHALLGRALFVSFLEKRRFIKPRHYPKDESSLLAMLQKDRPVSERKALLYEEFFPLLRREFNGTMFDAALEHERRGVRKTHLDILWDFLSGHDMKSSQMTLDFWAYDFSVIPVETISAIYEDFMKESNIEKKRQEGAYYTPRHLAETALYVALEDRWKETAGWRVLDPACGSGIFLVAMFNLLAEQWLRENAHRHKKTKAQALLEILQEQIRGVDVNPNACRITAFSLYLALFEKLRPIDVDEFKEKVRADRFLPPLVWQADAEPLEETVAEDGDDVPWDVQPEKPVVIRGDFLNNDELPLDHNHDLVIGNPPWKSRGGKQLALHFAQRSPSFLRDDGIGCLLLPTSILVNLHGSLDGEWFSETTAEKIVQLADFRRQLFDATHACFILRFQKAKPSLEHCVVYETPKLNRFDRRRGVIVVEPDEQKFVPQRDIVEAAIQERLQFIWRRRFWGTPRDEACLRRLDFYPALHELVGEPGEKRRWIGGVGFKPYYPGYSHGDPIPLAPWKLSDDYLPNDARFPRLVLTEKDFTTLEQGLQSSVRRETKTRAMTNGLHRKPSDKLFIPPLVIYSNGFTKFAFCQHAVRFQDSLRAISGTDNDADLLRFLAAVLGSRLVQYQAFHSGSSSGIGRDKLHLYESLAIPFPLPTHELVPPNAAEIVRASAKIVKEVETKGLRMSRSERAKLAQSATERLEPLVNKYFLVTPDERILIDDTLDIFQKSIHKSNLQGNIPAIRFPERRDRELYSETLCDALHRMSRKQSIQFHAQGMASEQLNLIFMTIIFRNQKQPYEELNGDNALWKALGDMNEAAQRDNGPLSYLRGFSYFQRDRLHILKPATLRNWCRTAALNDADAIFEYLNTNR